MMKRETIRNLYGLFIAILLFVLSIAYAEVLNGTLEVQGEAEAKAQTGVFITDIEYYANSGADTANCNVLNFTGTMLNSKVTLGASTNSTYTYKVTMHNNTDKEYVFIGAITNKSQPSQYSNTNIDFSVESISGLTGLEEYTTTIAPGGYLTFPVTFKYTGSDVNNRVLTSYLNFRFREKPVLELSNNGQTYTLENIVAGHEEEYEFTVSNYNKDYTNSVPMTYTFETTLTEGSPLVAKIYDENGAEVTGNISELGDGTLVDHTYKLKLTWDSSLDSTDYEGQGYTCNVKLKAIPDDTSYAEYAIEKGFGIDITTMSIIPISTAEQLLKIGSGEEITIDNKTYKFTANASYELQNNITFSVADYVAQYPNLFEGYTYTEIRDIAETITDKVTNYGAANSTSNEYYTYTAPYTGKYKLEVWGANGGSYNTSYATGGIGGYSLGTITLTEGDNLYVYVGGKGSYSETTEYKEVSAGGYNGGGNVGYRGGSGGGASDIRIGGTTLYDRVIVSGGGGGAYSYSSTYKANGGNGGGTTGSSGSYYSSSYSTWVGGGATQTSGGTAGKGSSTNYNGKAGTFGVGANTGYKYNSKSYYSNGAGRWRLVWRRFSRKLQWWKQNKSNWRRRRFRLCLDKFDSLKRTKWIYSCYKVLFNQCRNIWQW